MSGSNPPSNQKSAKQQWLLRLIDGIFWLFFLVTIITVLWLIFVPTPAEFEGSFPKDFSWENATNAILRHLALFGEHFPIQRFIDVLNSAFLTMFIYKLGVDVKKAIGTRKDRKIPPSIYAEWAMGSLFSGIIFLASRITGLDIGTAIVFVASIAVFSFVIYYFIYRIWLGMKEEEKREPQDVG